jgi:hypothetical protein
VSALRLIVFPAGRNRAAQAWQIRTPSPSHRRPAYVGFKNGDDWSFASAYLIDRARLARIIHLVPSSRGKVGKAILTGDEHARLRAKRNGGAR